MNKMHSFCINQYNNRNCNNNDLRNDNISSYCTDYEMEYYLGILKKEKIKILDNFHRYIDLYVDNDKNIFNGNVKFNEESLIDYENIFIAVTCRYNIEQISIEMYFLNKLPHIMINKDIFFTNFSIIKKYKKIFNIPSYQLIGAFNKDLKNILYNLFDKTFLDMI